MNRDYNLKDDATSVIKRAIDLLFINNPTGTSMGVLFGILLHWLAMLFSPMINTWQIININALRLEYFIPAGIFIFNARIFLLKGHKYDPELEKILLQIKNAEKNKLITKREAQLQYTAIIRAYVNSYKIEQPRQINKEI